MSDFVVLTFNIRNDRGLDGRNVWWLRRGATVRAIEEIAPDIAGLQEVRPLQLRYLRARLPQYGFLSKGRDRLAAGGEHCPILYRRDRFTVSEWDVRQFAPDRPRRPGRIATVAHLAGLHVVNTHLDEKSAEVRERSASALVGWLGDTTDPWVVMGDFNATPGDAAFSALVAAGLQDALAHLPASGPGVATGHRFTGGADGRRIDHILFSAGLEVVEASIVRLAPGGRLPSDHWPVTARLRAAPRP